LGKKGCENPVAEISPKADKEQKGKDFLERFSVQK
jgi:hypothetical protein